MNQKLLLASTLLALAAAGCHNSKEKKETASVVNERYIHKYGYDVSKSEWENSNYPGQVVTTMRNGTTITSSFEGGMLHGPTTYTYKHSQTVQTLEVFERGNLVKKVEYTVRGIPATEELYLSPSHVKLTKWYPSGTPLSTEEYVDGVLSEGEYYNDFNEAEYHITSGSGYKVVRDSNRIIAKETYEGGDCVKREEYFANGNPSTITSLWGGHPHGEKIVFAQSGEPLSEENYSKGKLDGLCTYYQNGYRYLDVEFTGGKKNGFERHYIDGELVAEETCWNKNKRHGHSTVFHDGMSKTDWYYNNEHVSESKFNDLTARERTVATLNEWSHPHNTVED